jgi:hypothetical protein
MSNDIPDGLEAVELTGKEAFDALADLFFKGMKPMALEPTERTVWQGKLAAAGLDSEASRVAADIAINRMKAAGELHRLETERTVREERKWGDA